MTHDSSGYGLWTLVVLNSALFLMFAFSLLAAGVVAVAAAVPALPAMPAVHEHVHQRAGQQQQEGQGPEEVGSVFAEKKVGGDSAEHEQSDGIPGAPERRRAVLVELVGLVSRLLWVNMVVIHLKPPRVKPSVLAASIGRHARTRKLIIIPASSCSRLWQWKT